ncbi:gag-pol [Trichonephila clavipes]|nr:gag-pol [Trichonephila clavipes]
MSKGFKLGQRLSQVSVLSSTLFTLFMCGIEEVISKRCKVGFYPIGIVLFEADLQPLSVQRNSILMKYDNKLLSYDPRNRTSNFLNNWSNNQKLKRNSPYRVFFHPNLSVHVNKTSDSPEFLKQLALKVISNIPNGSLLMYTDGNMNKHFRYGNGFYIKSQNYSSHIKLRNSDGCSVFRSEPIVIDSCLKDTLSFPGRHSVWIFSDSRSTIQHLSNWHKVGDRTRVAILEKLKHLSSSREIHLQWVPSHVNIGGNNIADSLAKEDAAQHTMSSATVAYSELHSTYINSMQSTVPPAHPLFEAQRPVGYLLLQFRRIKQTILTRNCSGYLRN